MPGGVRDFSDRCVGRCQQAPGPCSASPSAATVRGRFGAWVPGGAWAVTYGAAPRSGVPSLPGVAGWA